MMRRGDLAQYPVDWVLREAGRDAVSGGIELHTSRPAVVYLKDGLVYLVLRDGEDVAPIDDALDDRGYEAALVAEEIRQRAHAVTALAELLEVGAEGYYFHHPLNDHPLAGAWGGWDPATLLDEASTRLVAADPPAQEAAPTAGGAPTRDGPPPVAPERTAADAPVHLGATAPADALDDDAWSALAALVGTLPLSEATSRLAGDDVGRGRTALLRLRDRGIVVIGAAPDAAGDGGPDADAEDDAGEAGSGGDEGRRRRWGR